MIFGLFNFIFQYDRGSFLHTYLEILGHKIPHNPINKNE